MGGVWFAIPPQHAKVYLIPLRKNIHVDNTFKPAAETLEKRNFLILPKSTFYNRNYCQECLLIEVLENTDFG